MKKWLKIGAGVLTFILVLLVIVFYLTSGISKIATEFFESAKQQDFAKAYDYLAGEFKKSTSSDELKTYLQGNGLDQVLSAHWSSRSVAPGTGELIGTVTLDDGGVIPVELNFVKQNGAWKLYSINRPASGITNKPKPSLPSEDEAIALVNQSMRAFGQAVDQKDMSLMYAFISNLWQQQTSVVDLNDAFKVFYSFGFDFKQLDSLKPTFDKPPSIDEHNTLNIKGVYQTSGAKVFFSHRYYRENATWKLLAFDVRVI